MNTKDLSIGSRKVTIYSQSEATDCPVIYIHAAAEAMTEILSLLGERKIILVTVDEVDWEADLSPWPAPKAFRGGVDFIGGGDAYLSEFIEKIVPAVEEILGFSPRHRIIAGYSMAGLFAIYALYRTDVFNGAVSVSGSLWYDDFLDFMKDNHPVRQPDRVYFSLGDYEAVTRNQRLATVQDYTEQAEKQLREMGVSTVFELNEGNHFADVSQRITKGLDWILNVQD